MQCQRKTHKIGITSLTCLKQERLLKNSRCLQILCRSSYHFLRDVKHSNDDFKVKLGSFSNYFEKFIPKWHSFESSNTAKSRLQEKIKLETDNQTDLLKFSNFQSVRFIFNLLFVIGARRNDVFSYQFEVSARIA